MRWVLATWLKKAGDWDCIDAPSLSAAQAERKFPELVAAYGPPKIETTDSGETVKFTWFHQSAMTTLYQQPCP